jgi:hypothetical protein
MRKRYKTFFWGGLIIFLSMQLYQPARNVDKGQVSSADFTKAYNVPNNIQGTLKTSCYDCHSNNTRYLWYDYIQPARMLIQNHIKNGKENLNFNEWGNYSSAKQIKSNEMPLVSYTLIHKNAALSDIQKRELLIWLNELQLSISLQN